jgi:hypothetical protein
MNPAIKNSILGGALLLTLVAIAYVNQGDDAVAVVKPKFPGKEKHADVPEKSGLDIEKLKRAAMSDDAKELFAAKSWYVPPPPPPQPKPVAPPLPFVYIGKMIENDGKTLVFLAKQGRIYSVSEGETFDGVYSVDAVKVSQMTLTYLPLHEKQMLNIGESN